MKTTTSHQPRQLAFGELVGLTAAVMALNALAIDMMLPALTTIGNELSAGQNRQQLIIGVYVMGNGIAQLFFGPIVDRFGRRIVLMLALGGYLIGSLLSVIAADFTLLLAARGFQGIATAATRVASIAMVRDQCAGRQMARVMSLAITVFMAAPILAPSIGQLVLSFAPWRGIFIALLIYGLLLGVWVYLRMPETLNPSDRKTLQIGPIMSAYGEFLKNRVAFGYTLASAFCFGALFGYISASEQIFKEIFNLGDNFPLAFAVIAAALAAATLTNARLVERFGMRRLTHSALLAFILSNVMHLLIVMSIGENMIVFLTFMSIAFFALGLIGPNSSALAMEPMGHMAGAAAAANGFAGTTVAGFLGTLIGQFYNHTTTPIILGFAILGIAAIGVVLWVEDGKLLQPNPTNEPSP
ncbi:MAG: multidrug effflux MFS transporter [Pseudomonadota bacterium]